MRADVIDLSHYDDVQDGFEGAKGMGVVGVINKLTEGDYSVDPSFAWRRAPAARAGLRYGAYHFIRPGDPEEQAKRFLDHLGDPAGLRLALDHEDPHVPMSNARAWLEYVHDKLGHWPVYYSFQSFILDHRTFMPPEFWRQVKLWLAAYNSQPRWPIDIWPTCDLWQFTGDGNGPPPHHVPGIAIAGGCDINEAHDRAALLADWATAPESVGVHLLDMATLPARPAADDPGAIMRIAATSEIAHYNWSQRGRAPLGYVKGVALTFARCLRNLKANDPMAQLMARPPSGDAGRDALSWYAGIFDARGMENIGGPDTLRHVFALLMGLGMRESSGVFTEGRDTTAENVSADTAEAGLFQQSWGTSAATPLLGQLLADYSLDSVDGFANVFREGVSKPKTSDYGSGTGRVFQTLCKTKPAFAVEAAAMGLRVVHREWGPINRREAELRIAADTMLKQVQEYVDAQGTTQL